MAEGLLVALGAKPRKDDEPEEDDAKTIAAEELVSAIKSGKPDRVSEAFAAMMQACDGMHDDVDEPEDDEDEEAY